MATLSSKQVFAANLIAQGMRKKDVAVEINLTPQTISVWCAKDEFNAYLNAIKFELLEDARDRMRTLSGTAVDTIRELKEESAEDLEPRLFEKLMDIDPLYGQGNFDQLDEDLQIRERHFLGNTLNGILGYLGQP
jgi:hypothetical protein